MLESFLLSDPLPGNAGFICRVKPITLATNRPQGVRGVPLTPELLPVYINQDGGVRSDGTRMDFWGDDPALPRVASEEELPGGPDKWLAIAAACTRTASPRVRIMGCNETAIRRSRWNKDKDSTAQPAKVFFHREDVSPWFAGVLHGNYHETKAGAALFTLAAQGKVDVLTVYAAADGSWNCTYSAKPPGLNTTEWASLGRHSLCGGAPTLNDTIAEGTGTPANPLLLPGTHRAIAENGFALNDEWRAHYTAFRGRISAKEFLLRDPAKAAAYLRLPEFASLPAGARLVSNDYLWSGAIAIADLPRITFKEADKELSYVFNYKDATRMITLPDDVVADVRGGPLALHGDSSYGAHFLVTESSLAHFVSSEQVGRKFLIPAATKRLKLRLLTDGTITELPGTYLHERDTHGLPPAAKTRRERKERREALCQAVKDALGAIPEHFDADRHSLADAQEHARLTKDAQARTIEPLSAAIDRLCAIAPISADAANELIQAHHPVHKDPLNGILYLAASLNADDFADENAGEILARISPKLPGYLVKVIYSETARNSIAIAGIGGT